MALFSNVNNSDFNRMNDRGNITKNIEDIKNVFNKHSCWLKNLIFDKDKTNIILTHHLPTDLLLVTEECKTGYATNIIDEINLNNISYFISGHMHIHREIKINNTKFIVNPLGYINENTGFKDEIYEI